MNTRTSSLNINYYYPPRSDRSRGRRRFCPFPYPAPVRLSPLLRPRPAFPPSTTAAAVPVANTGARAGRGAILSVHALRLRVLALRRPRQDTSVGSRGLHRRFRSSAPARNLDVRRRSRERERADGRPSIGRDPPPSGPVSAPRRCGVERRPPPTRRGSAQAEEI